MAGAMTTSISPCPATLRRPRRPRWFAAETSDAGAFVVPYIGWVSSPGFWSDASRDGTSRVRDDYSAELVDVSTEKRLRKLICDRNGISNHYEQASQAEDCPSGAPYLVPGPIAYV